MSTEQVTSQNWITNKQTSKAWFLCHTLLVGNETHVMPDRKLNKSVEVYRPCPAYQSASFLGSPTGSDSRISKAEDFMNDSSQGHELTCCSLHNLQAVQPFLGSAAGLLPELLTVASWRRPDLSEHFSHSIHKLEG